MRVGVKVCGLTTPFAVRAAVCAGADAVGFVFARSPRQVTPELARRLLAEVPPFVTRVAVMRWPSAPALARVLDGLEVDVVQLYPGAGDPSPFIGARRYLPALCDTDDLEQRLAATAPTGPVLLDGARAGHGEVADWSRIASAARERTVVLAGGLTPENVQAAIRAVRPVAVDVSSGVESSPGLKDAGRITDFVAAVREMQ